MLSGLRNVYYYWHFILKRLRDVFDGESTGRLQPDVKCWKEACLKQVSNKDECILTHAELRSCPHMIKYTWHLYIPTQLSSTGWFPVSIHSVSKDSHISKHEIHIYLSCSRIGQTFLFLRRPEKLIILGLFCLCIPDNWQHTLSNSWRFKISQISWSGAGSPS